MVEVDERADRKGDTPPFYEGSNDSEGEVRTERYEYEESQKVGIFGSAFLILNKMIGTGSKCAPAPLNPPHR